MSALLEYRKEPRVAPPIGGPFEQVLHNLHRIAYDSFDALNYVTDLSHLVYATTLLDTFLSDTTLFLLLLYPRSIGKNQQVPLSSILGLPRRIRCLLRPPRANRARCHTCLSRRGLNTCARRSGSNLSSTRVCSAR